VGQLADKADGVGDEYLLPARQDELAGGRVERGEELCAASTVEPVSTLSSELLPALV
jgi:hypothetical protein